MGLKPEWTLAALASSVAATWHPTKNRNRKPSDTAATSTLNAIWRCSPYRRCRCSSAR
ncbi:zinc-ribbon domain-containing protein [Amycolatopsis japonica]|uniref:zinc-ribbon domain-containing protein n=1 Tax=Amycolatopsis japonica TaxID=208439 RepID=UPI003670317A